MLERRQPGNVRMPAAERPDPAVSLAVGLFGLTAIALLIGGILAVYDWTTPGAEKPLFFAALSLFGATVAMLIGVATARYLRSAR